MKVALVTTPPSVRSGIGDYTRHLLPYLREHCDVRLFVDAGVDDPAWGDERASSVHELRPGEFDQLVYQIGNERSHGFMARMIRSLGGTAVQHDWVLFDMALAAWPSLARGGAKGHVLALREGGLTQARAYCRNWIDRRGQRNRPEPAVAEAPVGGTLLSGWHEPEDDGRWTTDHATLRLPGEDVRRVRLRVRTDAGRRIRVLQGGELLAEVRDREIEVALRRRARPVLTIETQGIRVTREQRRHGDSRRLGCFVERVTWKDGEGEHEVDLLDRPAVPVVPVTLSRDRFALPLNRSVVRFADAFVVHSEYVRDLILRDRNARTATAVVHHGAECRWRDEPRSAARARLGLPPAWHDGFVVTSFGGVQPHKRVDRAIEALAVARRQRDDVRLVLAGSIDGGDFDPRALVRRLGLEDAVHFTGFVPEEEGWDWLHAGDLSLNLRGPSSGGTSGGIFQAFSLGRAVVASDAAEQRELPDSCTIKVPLGGEGPSGEVEALARTLIELRDDPARRRRLEEAVQRFVREECHWGVVARRYAEALESFPGPRISRRKLVSLRVDLQRRQATA